jgi:hypothetical protein
MSLWSSSALITTAFWYDFTVQQPRLPVGIAANAGALRRCCVRGGQPRSCHSVLQCTVDIHRLSIEGSSGGQGPMGAAAALKAGATVEVTALFERCGCAALTLR